MTDRVEDDDSLIPPGGRPPNFFAHPVVIVHKVEEPAVLGYVISLAEIDENMDTPAVAGIMLSDLLDHLAKAYAAASGRDQRDVRAAIFKVMRDEDRFKEKDPTRGGQRGATMWPKRN
jgi:hypothetical protein